MELFIDVIVVIVAVIVVGLLSFAGIWLIGTCIIHFIDNLKER
jgi:hypothetical protein